MQNFGKIKNVFNNILAESILKKDKEKKKIFSQYLKTLKENKILNTQFSIYKNIEEKCSSNDVLTSEYIKENIALLSKFNANDILKENEKLMSLAGKSKGTPYDSKLEKLHEDITNLIFTKKSPKTINNLTESFDNVVNYIKSNQPKETITETPNPKSSKLLGQLAVDKFNDKFKNLSETERKIIKSIIESDETTREELFKTIRTECVDLVNQRLDESDTESKEKLLKVKDKLLRMDYNKESFINDTNKIIDLKENLSTNI
jgi:hypothetical protein